ncbi:MAG: hypothetical protein U0031_07090 [Thermomicrobiales bacterium]
MSRGYDHNFVFDREAETSLIEGVGSITPAAVHPDGLDDRAGRAGSPAISSTGRSPAPAGEAYRQGDGIALETQHFQTRRTTRISPPPCCAPGEVFNRLRFSPCRPDRSARNRDQSTSQR